VLSDESHRLLTELMRFRHFKRYYLELDYDREKLRFCSRCFAAAFHSCGKSFPRFVPK
jgi:hypothetical protein